MTTKRKQEIRELLKEFNTDIKNAGDGLCIEFELKVYQYDRNGLATLSKITATLASIPECNGAFDGYYDVVDGITLEVTLK